MWLNMTYFANNMQTECKQTVQTDALYNERKSCNEDIRKQQRLQGILCDNLQVQEILHLYRIADNGEIFWNDFSEV